jgi:hypothetical protein
MPVNSSKQALNVLFIGFPKRLFYAEYLPVVQLDTGYPPMSSTGIRV